MVNCCTQIFKTILSAHGSKMVKIETNCPIMTDTSSSCWEWYTIIQQPSAHSRRENYQSITWHLISNVKHFFYWKKEIKKYEFQINNHALPTVFWKDIFLKDPHLNFF